MSVNILNITRPKGREIPKALYGKGQAYAANMREPGFEPWLVEDTTVHLTISTTGRFVSIHFLAGRQYAFCQAGQLHEKGTSVTYSDLL